jgi:hypothetical protein
MVLWHCTRLNAHNHCLQFKQINLQGFSGNAPDKMFIKVEIIQKREKRVMYFWHCTPSQCPLPLCEFKQIISKGFAVLLLTRLFLKWR